MRRTSAVQRPPSEALTPSSCLSNEPSIVPIHESLKVWKLPRLIGCMDRQRWRESADWQILGRIAGYSCKGASKLVGVNMRQVERHFHAAFGGTLRKYLRSLRMEDSAQLLLSDLRIYEVSALVGYNHANHFSRSFHQYHGVAPYAYRRNVKRVPRAISIQKRYCELLESLVDDLPELHKRLPKKYLPR